MKRALIFILLIPLLLCGCGEKSSRDYISIWYLEGDSAAAPLAALCEEYNAQLEEGLLPVGLRGFESEESLAAAFDSGRPDMILCDHLKAEDLQQREKLREIRGLSVLPAYPQYLEERLDCTGLSFFPIGHDVQLVCAKSGKLDADALRNCESLMAAVSGLSGYERLPAFTADDYSALFYQWLLSLSTEFHAEKSLDLREDNYKYVYNLIAQSAYDGAAVSMEYPALELVRQDYLDCAVLFSAELAGESAEGLELYRLPVFKDSRLCMSICRGLAVTAREGRSNRSMAAFLSFLLTEERASAIALEAALAPAAVSDLVGESGVDKLLLDISENCTFHLPGLYSDYIQNKADFEMWFRDTLDSLSVY